MLPESGEAAALDRFRGVEHVGAGCLSLFDAGGEENTLQFGGIVVVKLDNLEVISTRVIGLVVAGRTRGGDGDLGAFAGGKIGGNADESGNVFVAVQDKIETPALEFPQEHACVVKDHKALF